MKPAMRFGRRTVLALMAGATLLFTACGSGEPFSLREENKTPLISASPETAGTVYQEETEKETVQRLEVLVGGTTFAVQLADTEAAREFVEQLPLELEMQELNGNEKYTYLSHALTDEASCPSFIHTGDLMLFGSDCLVLFYKDFSTSYSYTSIGKLENPEGLSKALGSGTASVTFRALS